MGRSRRGLRGSLRRAAVRGLLVGGTTAAVVLVARRELPAARRELKLLRM